MNGYTNETRIKYAAAVDNTIRKIAAELFKLDSDATLQEVTDSVFFHLYTNWNTNFTQKQKSVINKFVTQMYRDFRKDPVVLASEAEGAESAVFNVVDLKTIEFYKRSDNFYLSKFITDTDTTAKINKFIGEEYLEGGTPIGRNSEGIPKFKRKFEGVLGGEDWKISRVIDTTVNKLRNYAGVQYMKQVEVEQFEIVGVSDDRQCPYCAELQGFRFSVSKASERIDNAMSSDHAMIGIASPFITALYKPSEIKGVGASTLQEQGIDSPPFHPHCRDVIVAVL